MPGKLGGDERVAKEESSKLANQEYERVGRYAER